MRRALRRFVSKLTGRNRVIFFVVMFLIVAVALSIAIYIQFFYKYADIDPLMIGIHIGAEKTKEEVELLQKNFDQLFVNDVFSSNKDAKYDLKDISKGIVFTGYNLTNEDESYYSINAQIPVINLYTPAAVEINNKIKVDFHEKANRYMRQSEEKIIYKVKYVAFVNQDVLSVVVKASLKEGEHPERVIIKTYNYNIPEKKAVTLSDLMKLKEMQNEVLQTKIHDEIKIAYNNARVIASQYGEVYERDLNSDIYKVENIDTYFLTQDGYVYLVFCYGNSDDQYTNVTDIVIF
jgi:hypothetical protein